MPLARGHVFSGHSAVLNSRLSLALFCDLGLIGEPREYRAVCVYTARLNLNGLKFYVETSGGRFLSSEGARFEIFRSQKPRYDMIAG